MDKLSAVYHLSGDRHVFLQASSHDSTDIFNEAIDASPDALSILWAVGQYSPACFILSSLPEGQKSLLAAHVMAISAFRETLKVVGEARFDSCAGLRDVVRRRLQACDVLLPGETVSFESVSHALDQETLGLVLYAQGYLRGEPLDYSGGFASFGSLLRPVAEFIRDSSEFVETRVSLFIADAHLLPLEQTEVLNGWIGERSQSSLSIKAASPPGLYKTFITGSGHRIEPTHDYSFIDVPRQVRRFT